MPSPWPTRAGAGALRAAAAGAILAALALGGCGSTGGGSGRTATVPAGKPVEVVAKEYSFDPKRIVVKRSAGAKDVPIDLRLRNDGSLAHNLKVLKGERELGGTPTFPGGETREGRVRLAPGSYSFVCTVANHRDLGMTGTLVVK